MPEMSKIPTKKCESNKGVPVIQGSGSWTFGGYSAEKTPNPTANVAGSEVGMHVKEGAEWVVKKAGEAYDWAENKIRDVAQDMGIKGARPGDTKKGIGKPADEVPNCVETNMYGLCTKTSDDE